MSLSSNHRAVLRRAIGMVAGLFLHSSSAMAGIVPAGSEFQVNSHTAEEQRFPAISSAANGDTVIVWMSRLQDGSSEGIFGQRYASDGSALGTEFQVNTYTPDYQGDPAVSSAANGDFLVVWHSVGQDGDDEGVFGQRYASDGSQRGSEFQVNTYTSHFQGRPAVAVASNGDVVVAWTGRDASGNGIFAQRYSSSGLTMGSEFQVNTYTTSEQILPTIGIETDGDFVVAWSSRDQDTADTFYGVFAQRYASDGSQRGDEFQVNDFTPDDQIAPGVTVAADGDFVITWLSSLQDGSDTGVFARRYANDGSRIGAEFQVNSYTTGRQYRAAVAGAADGDFVVTWESRGGQDGHEDGVFAQCYDSDGSRLGAEFQVNSYTTDDQDSVAVASSADGNVVVVVWDSAGQDGNTDGVFAQRYTMPTPTPTPTDIDGDGVLNTVESSGPNGGDANDDGTQDEVQEEVSSLPLPNGDFITMVTSGDCGPNMVVETFGEHELGHDPGFSYPFGLIGFELSCPQPGASADIVLLFHGASDLSEAIYRKFGPLAPLFGPPEFYTLPGVTFGTTVLAGETVATVHLSLTDGMLGDDTPVDSLIVDQGGPAFPIVTPAPALSSRMILVGVAILLAISSLALWRRRSRRTSA